MASCILYPRLLLPLELATVVNVQNLSKVVSKEKILTNLTFHLAAGDCLALLGANGSGKSLLLKILATLVKPSSGKVTIAEHDAFTNLDTVRPYGCLMHHRRCRTRRRTYGRRFHDLDGKRNSFCSRWKGLSRGTGDWHG